MERRQYSIAVAASLALAGLLAWPVTLLHAESSGNAAIESPGVVGSLDLTASDATLQAAESLKETLQARHPGLILNLHTASITETTAWWRQDRSPSAALLAQPMTDSEQDAFRQDTGYEPSMARVATDALVVVVHPRNPLAEQSLTLADLDALYSATRCRGEAGLRDWGQLGLQGRWEERPIVPIAQPGASALSDHFRREVMCDRGYRPEVLRLKGSAAVLRKVGSDLYAIGYVARSQVDARVRTVKVTAPDGNDHHRFLYPLLLYLQQQPGQPLAQELEALLRFIYSREGMALLTEAGFGSIPADIAEQDQRRLGVN